MPSREAAKADLFPRTKPKGRTKLSKSQRERKRESDREAQRQIRSKTKSHIAHLEQLVKTLQDSHADDARTNDLIEQIKSNRKEIDSLREFVRGVSKLVEGVQGLQFAVNKQRDESHPAATQVFSTPPEDTNVSSGDLHEMEVFLPSPEPPSAPDSVNEPLNVLEMDNADSHTTSISIPTPRSFGLAGPPHPEFAGHSGDFGLSQEDGQCVPISTSSDDQISRQIAVSHDINAVATEILQARSLDGRLYYLAGSVLYFILGLPRGQPTPEEFTEDIAIRAVLGGWETVAEQYDLDPGWLWLRHLDAAVYSAWGLPERLACLRIMRLLLQARMWPQQSSDLELPAFLAPRPSQKFMEHDPLVEYFVWPGMREHMIFGPRKYATNMFMDTFRNQIRFAWPHNPEDTFSHNIVSGMYSFSPEFIARQNDIRCWAMRSEFFVRFPEFRQDIPCFDDCLSLLPQLFVPPGQSSPITHAVIADVCPEQVVNNKPGTTRTILEDGLSSNYIVEGA
ncbi:hypothetical protein LTR13_008694 [Exophiala sideris]|nr:hypothetical protein LTR13_008694 [Exophiala sideris]